MCSLSIMADVDVTQQDRSVIREIQCCISCFCYNMVGGAMLGDSKDVRHCSLRLNPSGGSDAASEQEEARGVSGTGRDSYVRT